VLAIEPPRILTPAAAGRLVPILVAGAVLCAVRHIVLPASARGHTVD
jgi:hypothetical protein